MILLSPQIAKYQIGNILNSIYWILCIVLISILFRRQHINKYFIYIFMLSSIYIIILLINSILWGNKIGFYDFAYIFIPLFIFYYGLNISNIICRDISTIADTFLFSCSLLIVSVYYNYYITGYSIESSVYAAGVAKNSIGPLIVVGLIFIISGLSTKFNRLFFIFFYISLVLLKSRTPLYSFTFFILPLYLFNKLWHTRKNITKNDIIKYIAILMFAIIAILYIDFDYILNTFFYGGRDKSNIDELTSGRWTSYVNFFYYINEGIICGNIDYYIDNFFMNSILHYGIFAATVLTLISFTPIMYSLEIYSFSKLGRAFFYINILFFITMFLEAGGNLIPGSRSYILWILFGILTTHRRYRIGEKQPIVYVSS